MSSIETKEIRIFGIIAFVFFGCLCALGFWAKKTLPIVIFGSLSALGIGLIVLPIQLKPVYAGWLKIAQLIGKIVTTVMLTLAYYLVITPAALLKRLFSGRPLPIRPDKKKNTYWIARTEPAQLKERFSKRY